MIEQAVEVAGELKVGNFQLSFTDLVIPVAGIPIEITRVYDTLQADTEGEFGFGWRLEFRDTDLQVNLPESGLEDFGIFTAYQTGTRVYLNVPGEGRQGFTFNPDIRVLPGFGNNLALATPRFTADPGVTSTLSVGRSGSLVVNEFGELTAGGGVPYNPASPDFGGGFTLTTQEGIAYRVNGITGELESATDRNGNAVQFTDAGVFGEHDTEARFNRDAFGRITEIIDPLDQSILYSYNDSGDLVSVTDRNGNVTRFGYLEEVPHILDSVTDPLGRVGQRNEYNEDNRLVRVVDNAGNATELVYNIDDSTQIITDALGNSTELVYNNQGNVTATIDALGGLTTATFDDAGNQLSFTDQLGNTTSFTYDSRGNQTSVTDANGNVSTATFDSFSNVLSTTDALGNTTTNQYDSNGNLIQTNAPDGAFVSQEIDADGNITSYTDALGNVTQFIFEGGFQSGIIQADGSELILETNANGLVTGEEFEIESGGESFLQTYEYTYDANGQLTGVTNANGEFSGIEIDAAGQITSSSDAAGSQQEATFDEAGYVTAFNNGNTELLVENDALGNQTQVTFESGLALQSTRDALGRIVSQEFDGETATREFDSVGRLISEVDADGNTLEYAYDSVGNLIQESNSAGAVAVHGYDANNRRTQTTINGETVRFAYDDLGRLTRTDFTDGTFTELAYDENGNQISNTTREGLVWAYQFDELGNVTQVTDPFGLTTTIGYSNNSIIDSISDSLGRTRTIAYNEVNSVSSRTLPLGQEESFEYNDAGLLTQYTNFAGESFFPEYDSDLRLIRTTNSQGDVVLERTYDANGSFTVTTSDGTNAVLVDVDESTTTIQSVNGVNVVFSNDGTRVTTSVGERTYQFDDNAISSVEEFNGRTTTIQRDEFGNATLTEFDDGTSIVRTFDSEGRTTGISLLDSDDIVLSALTYSRDAFNRISQIEELDGRTIQYAYDSGGRLTSETVTSLSLIHI